MGRVTLLSPSIPLPMYVMKNVRIEDLDYIAIGILAKNAWKNLTIFQEDRLEALNIKRYLEKEAIPCEIHQGDRMEFLPKTTLIISCFTNQDFRDALCRISLNPPDNDLAYIVGMPYSLDPKPGYCNPDSLQLWKNRVKMSGKLVRLFRTKLVL